MAESNHRRSRGPWLWITLGSLIVVAAQGLVTAQTAFAVIGVMTAAIGIAIVAAAITQLLRETVDRPLFRPRAAVVGGMCLAMASLLCYTILLAGIGALFALAGAIVLVQDFVQPLQRDSMIAGATSVLVVALVIWFGAALHYSGALQASSAGVGVVGSAVGLTALRQRSVRATALHA